MLSCRLRKKLYHIFNYVFVRSTFISNAGNVLPPHLHLHIHLHLHFHCSFFSTLSFHYLHTFLCCASLHSLSLYLYRTSLLRLPTIQLEKNCASDFITKRITTLCLVQCTTYHTFPALSLSPIHSLTQTISIDLSALP